MTTQNMIPVAIDGTGEAVYLPGDTMVTWPASGRSRSKVQLGSFGERQRDTSGDPVRLDDGRLARLEGWKDEALRLRSDVMKFRKLCGEAADAIESAADVIESFERGDIDGECADNREFATELRKAAGTTGPKPEAR